MFLFDVDGTLIRTNGAGVRAFNRGLQPTLGSDEALADISPAGKTDIGIAQEAARRRLGRELTAGELETVFTRYLACLQEELDRAAGFRVLPGIREFLEARIGEPRTLLGLGTGNLEAGARLKLSRGDLNRFFRFGGYGSDSPDRAELLRLGKARGETLAGRTLAARRVIVVGDTPLDVLAGKAIGARTLAVATGPVSAGQLAVSGADAVLESFADAAGLERFLAEG